MTIQTKSASLLLAMTLFIGCTSSSEENNTTVASSTPNTQNQEATLGTTSTNTASNNTPTKGPKTYYKPDLQDTWQWQLKKVVNNTSYNASIYDIDLFDSSPALIASLQRKGKKVMCSFSVGSYESWRDDHVLFDPKEVGNDMNGWKGEKWLDIRTQNVRKIMKSRIDLAVKKGCDGLEPDNMNGYLKDHNTGFNMKPQDQIDFNRFLADYAHKNGLFIALKNDLAQIPQLVNDFDLSVNEECFQYEECEMLHPFIANNKPVFNAEYIYNTPQQRATLCNESQALGFYTLVLPLALDDTFRFSCQDN